jgi:hypothetical protein
MSRFLDLTDQTPELGPGRFDFHEPDRLFPAAVAASHLHLWKPGDPIPDRGTRILIGAATWSGYEMHLLDVIDDALTTMSGGAPRVDVFNAGALTSPEAFAQYTPGLDWFQTPVVGVWRDGRLVERKSGYDATEFVARMFGSSAGEIVDYVRKQQSAGASDVHAPH